MSNETRYRVQDIYLLTNQDGKIQGPAIINKSCTKIKDLLTDQIVFEVSREDFRRKRMFGIASDLRVLAISEGVYTEPLHDTLIQSNGVRFAENYKSPILQSYQKVMMHQLKNEKSMTISDSEIITETTREVTGTLKDLVLLCNELNKKRAERLSQSNPSRQEVLEF